MSLFALGDTHLSFSTDKPMDVFPGWKNYESRLSESWGLLVGSGDTVVIPGDISWGMSLEDSLEDFKFIDALPGRKIIMRGNHDYWWSSKTKTEAFFKANNINTIEILHNNALEAEGFAICGTRGWPFEAPGEQDKKIILREAARLEMSLACGDRLGGEIIAFMHYPPISGGEVCREFTDVLKSHNVRRCYYAHLHGASVHFAFTDIYENIKFDLVSADYLQFVPKKISS